MVDGIVNYSTLPDCIYAMNSEKRAYQIHYLGLFIWSTVSISQPDKMFIQKQFTAVCMH